MSHQGVIVASSDADFEDQLRSASGLVVIDFMATWCGPCKMIAPVIEELAFTYTHVKFLQVDVDRLRQAASSFQITAMPTLVLYRAGQTVQRIQGANVSAIRTAIATHAGPIPTAAAAPKKPVGLLPTQFYLNIEGSTKEGLAKITQKLSDYTQDKLSDTETRLLSSLVELISGTSFYHSSRLADPKATFALFHRLLERPFDNKFAAIDLLRQLVLHPHSAAELAASDAKEGDNSLLGRLVTLAVTSSTLNSAETSQYATKLMIWRFIANAMYLPDTRKRIVNRWADVSTGMEALTDLAKEKAPLRVAVATALLNASVDVFDRKDQDGKIGLIPLILQIGAAETDADVLQRVLSSAGTIAFEEDTVSDFIREGALIFVNRVDKVPELARLKTLAAELRKMIDTFDSKEAEKKDGGISAPPKPEGKVLPW